MYSHMIKKDKIAAEGILFFVFCFLLLIKERPALIYFS